MNVHDNLDSAWCFRPDAPLAGAAAGPLAGRSLAASDLFAVAGWPMAAGSTLLGSFRPAYTAAVVERALAAGARIVGRTRVAEFNLSDAGAPPGSVVAVAADEADAVLDMDTTGELRRAAADAGVAALRPTFGAASRFGAAANASSLDQPTVVARTAREAAAVLAVIAGHDPRDAMTRTAPTPDAKTAPVTAVRDAEGLRIGVPSAYRTRLERAANGAEAEAASGLSAKAADDALRALDAAAAVLEKSGASARAVEAPMADAAARALHIVASTEAYSTLARYDGVRFGVRAEPDAPGGDAIAATRGGFGPEAKLRTLLGAHLLGKGLYEEYFERARRLRARMSALWDAVWRDVDVAVSPMPAFDRPADARDDTPARWLARHAFTAAASLGGFPAMVVPLAGGGAVQLMARRWNEAALADAAQRLAGA